MESYHQSVEIYKSVLERAESAKQETKITPMTVEVNRIEFGGSTISWGLDLREGQEKDDETCPVVLFIEGFGQQTPNSELTKMERYLIEHGYENGIKRFVFASTHTIPNKITKTERTVTGPIVRARMVENALEATAGVGLKKEDSIPPISITAYSIGANTATAVAADISKAESSNSIGKHRLTMLSLSGISNFSESEKPGAIEAAKKFSTEVLNFIGTKITSTIKATIEGINHPSTEKNESPESLLNNIGAKLAQLSSLYKVLSRAITAKSWESLGNDIAPLLSQNESCGQIGPSFDVAVKAPAGDLTFTEGIEFLEQRASEGDLRGITWQRWEEHLLKSVFKKANSMPRHTSPTNNPERFVPESTFFIKNTR